jgi:hypothetical protein
MVKTTGPAAPWGGPILPANQLMGDPGGAGEGAGDEHPRVSCTNTLVGCKGSWFLLSDIHGKNPIFYPGVLHLLLLGKS